jgi:uncharacterized protein with von Willebrand factor type A (vWA) domain
MEPMQHTLESFLRALRAQEVRVSPAEAIDAHRAAAEVGFADRALLKDALCVTLAKSADEVERFDRCFDTFFSRSASRAARRPASGPAAAPAGAPNLASQLLEGDEAALAQAMEAAAARVGAGEIRLTSQRNLLTRRMLDEMGLRDLEAMIQALRAVGGPRDQALADQLAARRAALFVEAAAFVERQSRLYASETGRRMRDALLAEQKLTAVESEDFRAMEALVRRMAKRLATKYSRQRHRAHQGKLDVRRTIRRSMGHGGIPFEVVWKTETLNKPKIAVMCDVSRSVASAAQFLLLFLYSLNEVVVRLDAFAFSDRLVSVNDLLDDEKVDDAITLVMARVGFRPTDYGRSLADFCDAQGSKLDRRTTVIILGDGRSNYADPRLDLMRTLSQRARSVIWLNPEPETYWGQGDSKMDAYQRFCTVAKPCNTLTQLERIIEDVLRTYTSK